MGSSLKEKSFDDLSHGLCYELSCFDGVDFLNYFHLTSLDLFNTLFKHNKRRSQKALVCIKRRIDRSKSGSHLYCLFLSKTWIV